MGSSLWKGPGDSSDGLTALWDRPSLGHCFSAQSHRRAEPGHQLTRQQLQVCGCQSILISGLEVSMVIKTDWQTEEAQCEVPAPLG